MKSRKEQIQYKCWHWTCMHMPRCFTIVTAINQIRQLNNWTALIKSSSTALSGTEHCHGEQQQAVNFLQLVLEDTGANVFGRVFEIALHEPLFRIQCWLQILNKYIYCNDKLDLNGFVQPSSSTVLSKLGRRKRQLLERASRLITIAT